VAEKLIGKPTCIANFLASDWLVLANSSQWKVGVMRICGNTLLAVGLFAGLGLPVAGQMGTKIPVQRAPHPYTAQFKITSEQTLANGTTITHESTEIQVVDSEGRRLTEIVTPATDSIPERSTFHVFDPVARTNTTWMVPGKKATVRQMAPPLEPGQTRSTCFSTTAPGVEMTTGATPGKGEQQSMSGASGEVTPMMVQPKGSALTTSREDLGTQTIQGLVANGSRITTTTPAGAAGNDAPLVRTMESWNARSLGLVVRSVLDDPRNGKRTRELVELNQGEPELSSFQPPADYEMVTEEMHEVPCPR